MDASRWLSFTATFEDAAFFDHMRAFTGNEHGTGGIVTFPDSPWRLSFFLPRQPHFAGQGENQHVLWGYGLNQHVPGERVRKTMSECSGRELLEELARHLGVVEREAELFGSARCLPCQMPWITSQFMPRGPGDRPEVVPEGATNFAFMGQFVEVPLDTVFTVEYSVRTAWLAVSTLVGGEPPPPVYRGDLDPRVGLRAVRALGE